MILIKATYMPEIARNKTFRQYQHSLNPDFEG